jgi:heterodisulfide reductase subunit A-like polyferredoxin
MEPAAKLVYCHCAYAQVVPPDVKQQVLRALTESDASFEAVPDLCEMAARRDAAMARIATAGAVRIAACYPRAVRALFVAAGTPLPPVGVEIVNMRTATGSDAAAAMLSRAPAAVEPVP